MRTFAYPPPIVPVIVTVGVETMFGSPGCPAAAWLLRVKLVIGFGHTGVVSTTTPVVSGQYATLAHCAIH